MSKEILCKRCGEPLAEDDRGRFYAQVCAACCDKHGLCQDCGGSIVIPREHASQFACTGWHTVEGLNPFKLETKFPIAAAIKRGDIKIKKVTKFPYRNPREFDIEDWFKRCIEDYPDFSNESDAELHQDLALDWKVKWFGQFKETQK